MRRYLRKRTILKIRISPRSGEVVSLLFGDGVLAKRRRQALFYRREAHKPGHSIKK